MTKRIRLIPLDAEALRALASDAKPFESRHQVRLGEAAELLREVARQTIALHERSPRQAPWGSYAAMENDTPTVVGACGFKHAPTADGEVEIAYFTFPWFERRGFATAMAAELFAIAAQSPEVRRVLAHTLPEPNASTHVLQKNGLKFVGEVIDPEDGKVWRWQRETRT